MTTVDLMFLPAPDQAGGAADVAADLVPTALTALHLEGGRWRMQPPPTTFVTTREALAGVEEMLERIVGELDEPAAGGYLDAMQDVMQAMFGAVIPVELARKLEAEAAASAADDPPVLRLHLAPKLDRFPWELMHDGTGYLGLRYRIARMPLVLGGPKPANGTPRPVTAVVSLLGENVLDKAQRDDWQGTFDGLVNGGVTLQRHPQTDDWPTITALKQSGADVVYLLCHGLKNTKGAVFWSLNDEKPESPTLSILPQQARTLNLTVREPLVFANACHPLAGNDAAANTSETAKAGFGFEFFSFGASAFVGTIAPISKRVALPFARTFFEQLLKDGRPLGDALLATKQAFHEKGDADPSYLFYAAYGDPAISYVPGP